MQYEHQIDQATGASLSRVTALASQCAVFMEGLRAQVKAGDLPMFSLADATADLAEMENIARKIRQRFSRLVVLGTGGSSLGGKALAALNPQAPVTFFDNVDPDSMDRLMEGLDIEKTAFLVISKSGTTVETLAQLLVILERFRQEGIKDLRERCYVITMPVDNPLRRLAKTWDMTLLDHDPKLGGRFSVLSEVGLIPAAVAGLDIRAIRAGAAEVLAQSCQAQEKAPSAPMLGAALHAALAEQGKSIAVLIPYCDRLADFGLWFRQGWAESIGKQGKGTTPVRALGAVDQHSQLQLYLDGPRDKFFTFLMLDNTGCGPRFSAELTVDPALAHLRGNVFGDIFNAQQQATSETLARNGGPVRIFRMKKLDEKTLGALLMHFMLETVMTAHLLGVNAYDQPAVEESKQLARDYLLAAHQQALA